LKDGLALGHGYVSQFDSATPGQHWSPRHMSVQPGQHFTLACRTAGAACNSHWFHPGSAFGHGKVSKIVALIPMQHWFPLHVWLQPGQHFGSSTMLACFCTKAGSTVLLGSGSCAAKKGSKCWPWHWLKDGLALGHGYVSQFDSATPGQHWSPRHMSVQPGQHFTLACRTAGAACNSHWFHPGSAFGHGKVSKIVALIPMQHWFPLHVWLQPGQHFGCSTTLVCFCTEPAMRVA